MKVVDIFKQYKVNELQQVQGKVFMRQEKCFNRRVIQLDGNVTTSAVVNIQVNLHKNYLHFQMNVNPQQIFMINISFIMHGKPLKLSISNLYKCIKYPADGQMQVPCDGVQWGSIVVDCKSYFQFQEITNIQLSGALAVKNILNSNEELLPNEFQLHPVRHQVVGKTIMLRNVKVAVPIEKENQHKQPMSSKGILKKSKYSPLDDAPQPQDKVSPTKQEQRIFQPEQQQEQHDDNCFEIKPSPLMILKHIHGYTPSAQANIVYLDDVHFVYPCHNQLIIMNQDTLEQRYCSTSLPIAAICVNNKQIIAACQHQKSIDSSQCSEIVKYDYTTCTKLAHYKIEGYYSIHSMDVMDDYILVCASDIQQRICILYIHQDVIQIKQVSSFHIHKLRFVNKDTFISVGKENIRYWNVKFDSLTLQGHSPYLGNYTRETYFTDLMISERRVLACCRMGRVFQFIDKELSGVWQVSDSPINSLKMFDNFIITTHKDGIRYWKLDFSEVIRMVTSEIEVIGCDSRKSMICAFKNKSIAKVEQLKFQYIIHSHQQEILDMISVSNHIVTSSMDHTICMWSQDLQLEYSFRCLDGLANTLCRYNDNFMAGFDNGLLRVFDTKTYAMITEIDTKHPILNLAGSNHLFLVSQDHDTLVLNHKLQIIKQHKHKSIVSTGFNNNNYYIACHDYIKIFQIDTLSEIHHLNIPIESVDYNDNHLLLVSQGHIKRFDNKLNFLQELVTSVSHVKTCSNYVFCSTSTHLNLYDYSFRGDMYGTPAKQTYIQRVNKLVFHNESTIVCCVDDFLFMWDVRAPLHSGEQHHITYATQRDKSLAFELMHENQVVKRQPMDKQQLQLQNKKQPSQSPPKHKHTDNKHISPKHASPKQGSPKHASPQKQLIIEDQLPKLKFNKLHGHQFGSTIQQFPWNRQSRFYVLPAGRFLTVNYLNDNNQQQVILTDQVIGMHQYNNGILCIHPNRIQIFNEQMVPIKSIAYVGSVDNACVSPCGNYILMILDQKIMIIELISGRILCQSILQRGRSHVYSEWCTKQELMFVVLTGISSQLWRINQRALLEYCDLEIQPATYRSCAQVNLSGRDIMIVGQNTQLTLVDLRQGRPLYTVDNVSSQEITQVIASVQYLVLLTTSPNVYYFRMRESIDDMISTLQDKAQILSLDGVPMGYSSLDSDIMVACRSSIWYIDLKDRVTLKISQSIPQQDRLLSISNHVMGTSDGTIMHNSEEILVPKRQCLCLGHYGDIIVAGFDDGFVRLFKNLQMLGYIKVGKEATCLKCYKDHFIVGNESGLLYWCTGNKDIKMVEIQNAEFAITGIDGFDDIVGYSTGNQKVQILHQKINAEFNITLLHKQNDDIEFYLMDSYRFRSIEPAYMAFSNLHKDQVIMSCNNIIIRNYMEHLNLIVIETQVQCFSQLNNYIVVGRNDGTISLYDNEIELDKIQISDKPIHLLNGNYVGFGNLVGYL